MGQTSCHYLPRPFQPRIVNASTVPILGCMRMRPFVYTLLDFEGGGGGSVASLLPNTTQILIPRARKFGYTGFPHFGRITV